MAKSNKVKHSARNVGRAQRPGHKARRARNHAGMAARKAKNILRGNGQAFLDAWRAKQ